MINLRETAIIVTYIGWSVGDDQVMMDAFIVACSTPSRYGRVNQNLIRLAACTSPLDALQLPN